MSESVSVDEVEFLVEPGMRHGPFWARVRTGNWEPHTFRVLRRYLRRTHSCIDIGAWIGPTTLYAARLARWVHAVEPDPVAHVELATNVAANPNLHGRITLHRLCIAPRPGPIALFAGGMYHDPSHSAFGDSMSGIVPVPDRPDQPSCIVEGVRLTDFIAAKAITDCNFVKMDVEGGEYWLIPALWRELERYGMPTAYISFHSPAVALRLEQIGACFEELQLCYRSLTCASDPTVTDLNRRIATIRDWADETPGSPWRQFEQLIGAGVVATNVAS